MPSFSLPCSKLHPPGGESLLDPAAEAPGGLPPVVTLCGKMDLLDRLLVRLHATKHKVGQGVGGDGCGGSLAGGRSWPKRQYVLALNMRLHATPLGEGVTGH